MAPVFAPGVLFQTVLIALLGIFNDYFTFMFNHVGNMHGPVMKASFENLIKLFCFF